MYGEPCEWCEKGEYGNHPRCEERASDALDKGREDVKLARMRRIFGPEFGTTTPTPGLRATNE